MLPVNKNSIEESKILRDEDYIYIIKGKSGYKNNSSTQKIPISLLKSFISSGSNQVIENGIEPQTNVQSTFNTISTDPILLLIGDINGEYWLFAVGFNGDIRMEYNDGAGITGTTNIDNTTTTLDHTTNVVIANTLGGIDIKVIGTVNNYTFNSLPEYANDTAADADTDLSSGSLYKITADRTVYQKP